MFTALLLFALSHGNPVIPARETPATLDRVTVYSGAALVERVLTVAADEPGPMVVVTGPFPLSARRDSFQVKYEEGPGMVQGMEIRERVGHVLSGTQRDAMQSELEGLTLERDDIESKLAANAAARSTIDVMLEGVASGKNVSALTGLDADALLNWVMGQVGDLDRSQRGLIEQGKAMQLRIDDLKKRMGNAAEERYQEVRAHLFFEQPGTAQLRVIYLVDQAWWHPTYDVRVDPDLTGVNVALVAEVSQMTGEDWDNAIVVLSTSQPNVGLDPPALPNRSYTVPQSMRGASRGLVVAAPAEELAELGYASDDADLVAGAEFGRLQKRLKAPAVQVQDFGITTQFVLPEAKTVPSNAELHRFPIREVPLEVHPERYVVPTLSEKAYLRAEVRLTGDAPLLAGSARVFLGPDLLGTADFPVLRPGDSTTLNLGIDPNLSVSWETIMDDRDEPGLFGSTVRTTHVYRATLKLSANARGPVSVLMEEVIPLSRDSRIKVAPSDLQPLPLDGEDDLKLREEKGVYRWRMTIPPGATQNVRWGYLVSHDEDFTPAYSDNR